MNHNIVLLISANTEWQVVRELYPAFEIHQSPYGEWFKIDTAQFTDYQVSSNQSAQFPITFFHQGWGKIAAAAATQYA